MADNIIRFPTPGYAIDASKHPGAPPPRPWAQLTIGYHAGCYVVTAWADDPIQPGTLKMCVGATNDIIEASEIAKMKAVELGVETIRDMTSLGRGDPDGPEAA